ncbi:MAG: hypothetical protein ACPKPY_08990 [Nitrososphaeraceae archaeon]
MSKLYNLVWTDRQEVFSFLCYLAATSTIMGGLLHFLMVGPSLKPVNFPMDLLSYTDGLFILSGILQVFWAIPMIKNWNINWHYVGVVGTVLLTALLCLTRIPNPITVSPLVDDNPMCLLTETFQFLYIFTTITLIFLKKTGRDTKVLR